MNEKTPMLHGRPRREYMIDYLREYRKRNREVILKKLDDNRAADPEKYKKAVKRYYIKNFDKLAAKGRAYREKNREKLAEYQRLYRSTRKERAKETNKEYRAKNKASLREQQRVYLNNRLKTDPTFRLVFYMRSRMRCALKSAGTQKAKKTMELLGCDANFFRSYLEAKFTEGMTFDNYGSFWVVDHVIPISSFDMTNPEEQRRAFHYSNCQPLKWKDNHDKLDSMPEPHQAVLI